MGLKVLNSKCFRQKELKPQNFFSFLFKYLLSWINDNSGLVDNASPLNYRNCNSLKICMNYAQKYQKQIISK